MTSRHLLPWAAALGTLPYLTLKAIWLTGGDIGTTDPALIHSTTLAVFNSVTVALDLLVIALVVVMTRDVGRRLPAWLVLLPMWVGTGLLVPVVLALLPATLLADPGSSDFLEPWVRPMVYGGFAWQAVVLITAFVLYARQRWSTVVDAPSAHPDQLQRVTAAGGATMAGVSALLHAVLVAQSGSLAGGVQETVSTVLAVAGATGVVALVRGTEHRRLAVAAGWTGSAAMFAWGLWTLTTLLTASGLAAQDPVAGMAHLTGLLGGFALAVAGLLALAPRPALTPAAS